MPITTLAALRPKLDGLTTDILQALYLAAPVLQRDDFAEPLRGRRPETTANVRLDGRQQTRAAGSPAQHHIDACPGSPAYFSKHTLRVGTTGDYAPFSLEANGPLSGTDIDRAQQLAAHLHAAPVFIHTTWSSMSDDLSHGAFDVAMGGVSVTPAREAVGAFSAPMHQAEKRSSRDAPTSRNSTRDSHPWIRPKSA